jgi:hypothetical protein
MDTSIDTNYKIIILAGKHYRKWKKKYIINNDKYEIDIEPNNNIEYTCYNYLSFIYSSICKYLTKK